MMRIYSSHKRLFTLALAFFLLLTLMVAIIPALENQKKNVALPGSVPLTDLELQGKAVFVSEGCVGCHTQQVRNVEMDRPWGQRPSIASDYALATRSDIWRNSATLMGSERTGPDLTSIGNRQPSEDWHLLHLYNPRSVVSESVMPAYPWLFVEKMKPDRAEVKLTVPEAFKGRTVGSIIASADALALVAYLKSLKQIPLPSGDPIPNFLYSKDAAGVGEKLDKRPKFNGAVLYAVNCQSCHQKDGTGLAGAFPALKSSKIVLDDDPLVQITIIMKGYNGRVKEGYAIMPPVGDNNKLSAEEVTAIVNHERSSWGNSSKKVGLEQVRKIMESLK